MKNKKIFPYVVIFLISLFILITIYKLINGASQINQGKFRIADAILTCKADVTSNTIENSALSFTATQRNEISLLVQASQGVEIEKIYIKDIKTNKKSEKLYICQKGKEEKLLSDIKTLDLEWVLSDSNQILIELDALNENVVNNYILTDDKTTLIHDATAFSIANIDYEDLKFKLNFKVEIVEKSGKINELKVNLTLPKKEMLINGNYVERMDFSDLVFRVK